ncbi:hypothetical protein DRO59_08080, partial [Candidatus Bathyarchaeota archaeon]
MPEEYVVEVKVENEESLVALAQTLNEVNTELKQLNTSLTQFQKDTLTTARAVQDCAKSMRTITREVAESVKALNAQNVEAQKSTKQSAQLASASQRTTKEVKSQTI